MDNAVELREEFENRRPKLLKVLTDYWMPQVNRQRPPRHSIYEVRAAIDKYLDSWQLSLTDPAYMPHERVAEIDDLAEEYMQFASHDLRVIRSLRKAQEWADVVYHLQQATEKISTAYVIGSRLVQPEAKILQKHDIARRILVSLKSRNAKDYQYLAHVVTGQDYKILLTELNKLIDTPETGIRHWGLEEFKYIVRILLRFRKHPKTIPGMPKHMDQIRRLALQVLPEFPEEVKRWDADPVVNSIRASIRCYVLGVALSPHENSTRYPGRGMKAGAYTRDAAIVRVSWAIEKQVRTLYDDVTQHLAESWA